MKTTEPTLTVRPKLTRPNVCWTIGCIWLLVVATAMNSPAQADEPSRKTVTYTNLVNFDLTDGANPVGPAPALVQGLDGNLYGVANSGGTGDNCSIGVGYCGTVFKLTPSGTLTTVYNFCSEANCTNGASPFGLTLAKDGNLYGVTSIEAASAYCQDPYFPGCGTLYKITPEGELTTLYNWCSEPGCVDGSYDAGLQNQDSLIQASDGNFYGVTFNGGTGNGPSCFNGSNGCGTIFKITPAGTLTTLYSFCSEPNCADGSAPSGLVQGVDGNFYGTTNFQAIGGTVFQITPTGTFTTLYSFCSKTNCADGSNPWAGLTLGRDGNLYGTTMDGGANGSNNGTLFKITSAGVLSTIYQFCAQANCADGSRPSGALLLGTDGKFYGTTNSGGAYNNGTIFKITPSGTLTTLYSFNSSNPGLWQFGVMQATNGSFYGMTVGGGTANSLCYGSGSTCGTVYKLDVGSVRSSRRCPLLERCRQRSKF